MKKFISFFISLLFVGVLILCYKVSKEDKPLQQEASIQRTTETADVTSFQNLLDIMTVPDEYSVIDSDNPSHSQSLEKDGVIYTFYYRENTSVSECIDEPYVEEISFYNSVSYGPKEYRDGIYESYRVWDYEQPPDMIFGDSADAYLDEVDAGGGVYDATIKRNDIEFPVTIASEKTVYENIYVPLGSDTVCISYIYTVNEATRPTEKAREQIEELLAMVS